MTTPQLGDTLTCAETGAQFIAARDGCSVNYALSHTDEILSDAGVDIRMRRDLAARKPMIVYLSGDGKSITGWKGNELGRARAIGTVRLTRMSYVFGREIWSYRVTDCHGGEWYGRGAPGIAMRIRPCKEKPAARARPTYSVIVGNLGTVHTGHNRRVALREYRDWLAQVNADYRAHGQSVTYCENGEPVIETGAYAFEQTDTFSGEANYSWAKRGVVQAESLAHAGRIVRAELYAKGTRFNITSYGDMLDIRPRGICHVVFVSWHEGDKA